MTFIPRLTVLMLALALVSRAAPAQTLAEAAAVAQAAHATGMGWPVSGNGVPSAQAAAATLKAAPLPSVADLPAVPVKATTPQPEAYWRARWAPLTAQLATDRLALDPLALRYLELQARFNGMRTVFQQQLVAPELFRVQTELRKAQAFVDQDARAIADLEEDGRRAGALPGWFR